MKMTELKPQWRDYLRSNQTITAFVIALFAFIIICSVLFKNPRPAVIDYGAYTQTLYELGLEQKASGLTTMPEEQSYVITEDYGIGKVSILRLLQLEPTRTLIYPVRLICFFCGLLGISFSTKYLAFLLTLVTVGCIYSVMRSLYYFFGDYSAVIGSLICFIFLSGKHLIYFNSLYDEGTFYVSLLLFISVLLHIIVNDRNRGIYPVLKLILSALFFVNSCDTGILLLPFAVAAVLMAIVYCVPVTPAFLSYSLLCIGALLYLVRVNAVYTDTGGTLLSQTQIYHGLFTGILDNTKEPEAVLEELGLPPELVKDIGKNAYLPEEDYVISPYSQEADEEIYSKITYQSFLRTYWNHPDILKNIMVKTAKNAKTTDSSRFAYVDKTKADGTEWVERYMGWEWIRKILAPSSTEGYLGLFLLNQVFFLFLIIKNRKKKMTRFLGSLGLLFLGMWAMQFFGTVFFCGLAEISTKIHNFILLGDVIWILMISAVIFYLRQLNGFLSSGNRQAKAEEAAADPVPEGYEEVLNQKNPIFLQVKHQVLKGIRKAAEGVGVRPWAGACAMSAFGLAVMIFVLFCPRIGAYNNGDFGRMMEAMNLQYTEEDWKNPEELSLTKVVEDYDWVDNYDYTKVMYYNADLTQAWMSLVIKLIDNCMGFQFSTVYVAVIYVIILLLCFYTIMKIMFQRFGLSWTWCGLFLVLVLFDRDNLGWLNSLFGEGPAFVGLMMIIASSAHIINKERGTCKIGFAALLFSVLFFAGSKAQFTVTAPVLLLWILVLAVYHMPKKIWKAVIYSLFLAAGCVYIAVSVVTIYKKNEKISSQDTIYQSIFYGILMISEDPEGDLVELGLDPALSADAGKNAYLDKSQYYCAPRTEMAEEMIYSKVNTFTVLKFYLRHPGKLWIMMNEGAKAAAEPLPDYVLYVGQKTTEHHDTVEKNDFWQTIRPYVTANRFWELILIYGIVMLASVRVLLKKNSSAKDKQFIGLYLLIAGIGILQFPLSTIGNGLADNTKQLYVFRLTYDITVLMGIYMLLLKLKGVLPELSGKLIPAAPLPDKGAVILAGDTGESRG